MHGGRCIDKTNKYLCECAEGYEGNQCEFGITSIEYFSFKTQNIKKVN